MKTTERLPLGASAPSRDGSPFRRSVGAVGSQQARVPSQSPKYPHRLGSLDPDPNLYRGPPPDSFLQQDPAPWLTSTSVFGESRVGAPGDFATSVGDPLTGLRLGTWTGMWVDAALRIGEPHQVASLHLADRERVLAKLRVYPLRHPVVVLVNDGPAGPIYLPYLLEVDSGWTFDRANLELRDIVAPKVFGRVTLAGAEIARDRVSALVTVDGFVLEPTAPVHVQGSFGSDSIVAEFQFRESKREGHGEAFGAIRDELVAGTAGGAKGRNPSLLDTFAVAMRELALDALDQSEAEARREEQLVSQSDPEREGRILELAQSHTGLQERVDRDEGLLEAMETLAMDAAASAADEALYERGLAISARWDTFEPERDLDEQISEAEGRVEANRALQDILTSDYVPLRRLDIAAFARADEATRRESLHAVIVQTLEGIRFTRGYLATETLDPWTVPILFDATVAALGISDPTALAALNAVRERREADQQLVEMATLALQLGLAIGGFVTTGPAAVLLTLASTSVGAYSTLSSLEGYSVRSAGSLTDLDPGEALIDPAELDGAALWVALDLVGLGFDTLDVLKLLKAARPATGAIRSAQLADHGFVGGTLTTAEGRRVWEAGSDEAYALVTRGSPDPETVITIGDEEILVRRHRGAAKAESAVPAVLVDHPTGALPAGMGRGDVAIVFVDGRPGRVVVGPDVSDLVNVASHVKLAEQLGTWLGRLRLRFQQVLDGLWNPGVPEAVRERARIEVLKHQQQLRDYAAAVDGLPFTPDHVKSLIENTRAWEKHWQDVLAGRVEPEAFDDTLAETWVFARYGPTPKQRLSSTREELAAWDEWVAANPKTSTSYSDFRLKYSQGHRMDPETLALRFDPLSDSALRPFGEDQRDFVRGYRELNPTTKFTNDEIVRAFEEGREIDPDTGRFFDPGVNRPPDFRAVLSDVSHPTPIRNPTGTTAAANSELFTRNTAIAERQRLLVEAADPARSAVDSAALTTQADQVIARINKASESLGEAAADAFADQVFGIKGGAAYTGSGRDTLDKVYVGQNGRIYVVEAKGGSSPLKARSLADGRRAQQGTSEYLREIVRVMLEEGGPLEFATAQRISADWSKVEYYVVRQPIKDGVLQDVIVKKAQL